MRENVFYFLKELLWLTVTAMVAYAVLYPVVSRLYYNHWPINAAFVIVALVYFRYSLLFRSFPFLKSSWVRFVLFNLNLPLFVFLMYQEQKMISLVDNFTTTDMGFPKVIMYEDVKANLFHYLHTEIVFWGTASLLMITTFQIRLIVSYWQYYQRHSTIMMEE